MTTLPPIPRADARITLDVSQARIVLEGVPDRPGTAATIFCGLAEAGVTVGLIVEDFNHDGVTTLTFTLAEAERHRAFAALQPLLENLGGRIVMQGPIAKLTVAGEAVRRDQAAAARLFQALAAAQINIHMISTSEFASTVIVSMADASAAEALAQQTFAASSP